MKKFNLRAYGILIENGQVLTTRESYQNYEFNKFPGGGVEWGEGIEDTLKREFWEELQVKIEVNDLLFVNRNFLPSKFHDQDQIVCFYFLVSVKEKLPKAYLKNEFIALEPDIQFRWKELDNDLVQFFSLPLDIKVANILVEKIY